MSAGNVVRTIYERVVKTTALYRLEVWGSRTNDSRIIRQLRATQRLMLLSFQRAYKTTPTAALEIISRIPSLEVFVKVLHKERSDQRNLRIAEVKRPYPSVRV
ncbi:hypothetical protein NQ314_007565 [Rhamnusium bicolor]|uniref:Uncharacterized protein n=1 Tax=Rhamnusium bicolor TaxID=1586634 RepID=A0AAV8YLS9_9CUCU|nr:hypothetical protein NQ314_007565 [Rhamnusium bicolor]